VCCLGYVKWESQQSTTATFRQPTCDKSRFVSDIWTWLAAFDGICIYIYIQTWVKYNGLLSKIAWGEVWLVKLLLKVKSIGYYSHMMHQCKISYSCATYFGNCIRLILSDDPIQKAKLDCQKFRESRTFCGVGVYAYWRRAPVAGTSRYYCGWSVFVSRHRSHAPSDTWIDAEQDLAK
jgi:hypothetical protein